MFGQVGRATSDPFGVVVAALIIGGVFVYQVALIFSRFVFGGYLKRRHREKWNELCSIDARAASDWISSDATRDMYRFRTKSRENLGDPQIHRLRWISKVLYSLALLLILAAGGVIVIFAIWGACAPAGLGLR